MIVGSTTAQNLRQKGHFFLNQQYVSPSSIAFSDGLSLYGNYRGQWFGVEGSPQEQEIAASIYLPDLKSAVGLSINNEIIGAFRTTYIESQFAYNLSLKKSKLAFGLSLGIESSVLKGDILTTPEQTPTQVNTDPTLPISRENFTRPIMGLGVSSSFKGIQIDVSVNNLLNSASKIQGQNQTLSFRRGTVFNSHINYKTAIGNNFTLNPGVQVNTDFIQTQMSVYLLSSYKSLFHFGLMYRGYNNLSNDALIPILGFKPFNTMKMFYSYEIATNNLSRSTTGTHEVSISYDIPSDKIFKKGKVSYNPRFL
jgi:type IX secretion system PorP/SprF family membrane protein